MRNVACMEQRFEEKAEAARRRVEEGVKSGVGARKLASLIRRASDYERLQSTSQKAMYDLEKDDLSSEMRKIDGLQYERLKREDHELGKFEKLANPRKLCRRLAAVRMRRDRRKVGVESIKDLLDSDSDDDDGHDDEHTPEMDLAKELIDDDVWQKVTELPEPSTRTRDGRSALQ